MPTFAARASARSFNAVTTSPLNVQNPDGWSQPAWWKPEHGAAATPPCASACRAADSSEPVVHGSAAATCALRLPKPLSRRPASTAATNARSCASAKSSTVTGCGATTRIGWPRACQLATTFAGFSALGDIDAVTATCAGV